MSPRILLLPLLAVLPCLASTASAAVIGYSNDFSASSLDSVSGFTGPTPTEQYLRYNGDGATAISNASPVAAMQLSDATNTSYTISTLFRVSTFGSTADAAGSVKSVGLGFFSNNAAMVATSGSTFALFDYIYSGTNAGQLRLRNLANGTGTNLATAQTIDINGGATAGVIDEDIWYMLKVTVTASNIDPTHAADSYMIKGQIMDEFGTVEYASISTSSAFAVGVARPTSGYYFGVRSNFNNPAAGGAYDLNYDNFTTTSVPEPGALALGLSALGALGLLRRRSGKR
jgi:MYXO-CTERM domain-containing protein